MKNWMTKAAQRVRERYLAVKEFLTRREEGASLVEYALLVALIALACLVAIEALGGGISSAFNNIKSTLTGKI